MYLIDNNIVILFMQSFFNNCQNVGAASGNFLDISPCMGSHHFAG